MRYLFVCFVLFAFMQCSTPPQKTVNHLGFIPAKPLAILHTEDMESLVGFSNSQPQLSRFLHPLLSTQEHWLSFKECIVSYHEEGVKEYKYLLISPLSPLDSVPQIIGDTLRYENLRIIKFEKQSIDRYAAVNQNTYFESDSKILLENSIRLHTAPNRPDENLQKLYNSKSGPYQLFINERYQSLLNEKFRTTIPFKLSNFSSWLVIQPEIDNGNTILNVIGLLSKEKLTKMSLVTNQAYDLSKLLSNLPLTMISASLYGFEYDHFSVVRERYNAKHNLPSPPIDSLLMQARAVAKVNTLQNQIAVLDMTGVEDLVPILKKNAEATRRVREVMTFQFSNEKSIKQLVAPLLNLPTLTHAALFNNLLFLAPSEASLTEVITQLSNGYSLGSDEQFEGLLEEIPNESSLLFVGVEEFFLKQLNSLLIDDVQTGSSDKFPFWLGVGLVESGVAQVQFQKVSKQEKIENKRPKLLFSKTIESNISQGPNAVLNHLNGSMEWVIQDEKHNLTLISSTGKNNWTRPIGNPIQFPIRQVDLYKNSRLQMAYTTKKGFEVIDRNARPVSPFSSTLNNPLPLAVFDYENSRDYRLVLIDQNKLELRNRKFTKVSGFNRTKADLKYSPKHIRIGSRDYIVMIQKNGKLLLLDRRGNVRIKTPNNLVVSSNIYLHQNGFIGLDNKNRLFRIEINGKISYRTLPFETTYHVCARGKNLVLLTENKLEINGRLLELDFGLYGEPTIHVVNNRTMISLVDEQEEKVYVFDRKGNLLPHFPIYGAGPVTIDSDRKGKVFLATTGENNSLIVYQIPQ